MKESLETGSPERKPIYTVSIHVSSTEDGIQHQTATTDNSGSIPYVTVTGEPEALAKLEEQAKRRRRFGLSLVNPVPKEIQDMFDEETGHPSSDK